MKKKFKDTAIGSKIIDLIPNAKELIGDALPDKGLLGMVGNLIAGSSLSSEKRAELKSQLEAFIYADLADARANETLRDTSENAGWLSKNIHELMVLIMTTVYLIVVYLGIQMFTAGVITLDQLGLLLAVTGLKDIIIMIFAYLYGRSQPQK